MPTVDLSTHPVTPSPYGRWQALNAGLGLTAFGINAIVCDPGETIDTEHDETESGQQEAYIVVAGRAEFTVGSETSEAGPGTVIAVADTSVTRSFRALEPGTRVVCVGAVPSADAPEFGAWIGEAAS
jgi:mannose-6-phosphate isomerase-like protein (cupin superfamily)